MPSNNTPSNDADVIELEERNDQIYAHDHTTDTGSYGSTRAEALYNLGSKLERKKSRNPASKEAVEDLLNPDE